MCLNAVRDRLESEPDASDMRRSPPHVPGEENFVVEKWRHASHQSGTELTGVQEVREMSVLVRDLKRELGAATMKDILPRTKRCVESGGGGCCYSSH